MSAAQVWRVDEQRAVVRTVIFASTDLGLRQRLQEGLMKMRWGVRQASGAAEAMAQVEAQLPEVLLVDTWLPDLEVGEFAAQMRLLFPALDVLQIDGGALCGADASGPAVKSPRRNELLHAIREAQEMWIHATSPQVTADAEQGITATLPLLKIVSRVETATHGRKQSPSALQGDLTTSLPEMVGESAPMLELAELIRLVAPRKSTVLIEGETGTGKEVVAKALHRLSTRAGKAFVVLNCAAIPEALLEAELFGHTRGAFTGAVQSRTGRIEAAHGGTLFLDEIGEMPMALQAKMLRFLECGELQRVGDNDTMRVDVRVIAATHQLLEQRAEERTFRLDLYHRLAVFPIEVPALRERMEDLPLLVEYFLDQMGKETPRKLVSEAGMEKLRQHGWPGNVRELMHVLERGSILSGMRSEINADDIRTRGIRRDK